ncbi:MAG: polysaccharide biosynthesis/export family protein [Paludibacteraceae bacterium]|nr:polysaccharide biosynthesis/export family protein [Paludibacteraceae bacterium]
MQTKKYLFALGLFAVMATGCVTQKQMTYLQDADSSKADSINRVFRAQSETVIRKGDALTITVNALDKEAVVPYNMATIVTATPGSGSVQTTPMLQYYIVDENGDVEMPVLGRLHVDGLKRPEVEQLVKQRLEQQVLNPLVQVKLVGAKVSVLGEVNAPSQVPMTSGRMTILEALAAAGDMTPYGRRDNVLVTREVDGKLEIARVNLRSADLYTSPYYYLQQNDVVYVSPNKVRAISSANAGLWLSMVGTVASAATVIVTVVNMAGKM